MVKLAYEYHSTECELVIVASSLKSANQILEKIVKYPEMFAIMQTIDEEGNVTDLATIIQLTT